MNKPPLNRVQIVILVAQAVLAVGFLVIGLVTGLLCAVGVHTVDGSVFGAVDVTDVARGAHRHVELAVRSEADELPAVRLVRWKRVVHHNRFGETIQIGFDVVEA